MKRENSQRRQMHLNPVHWKVGNKILGIVLLVVLVSVLSLTTFSYVTLSRSTIESKGQVLLDYAYEAIQHASDIVIGSVDALRALALSPSIVEAVEEANATYVGRDASEVRNEIAGLDQAWSNGELSVDPLVAQIMGNEVSVHLRQFMRTFPEEVEVFVTDVEGVNVAMSARTGDYLQADEAWWQKAYSDGQGALFVSEVAYDESSQSWSINIGVPIRDKAGQRVVGVLRGTVDISVVFEAFEAMGFGETGSAALVDRSGQILYAQNQNLLMQRVSGDILRVLQDGRNVWRDDLHDLDGHSAIVAFHALEGELAESLGWAILLEQDVDEVNAEVQKALINSLLVAVAIAVILSSLGLWVARAISKSLVLATQQARGLALGDVGEGEMWLAGTLAGRGDETGELLRAFQDLRGYMQEMAGSARRLAMGDLAVEVRPRSEKDVLSHAFQQMVVYQQAMAESAGRLAEGDLTTDVAPQSEKDVLGHAFRQMLANLRGLVRQVQQNAREVTTASEQIALASEQSAEATGQVALTMQQVTQGAAQQSESLSRTSVTVNQVQRAIDGVARGAQEQAIAVTESADVTAQMSAAIEQVVVNARGGVESSVQATQIASKSADTIQATIGGMHTIKQVQDEALTRVQEMGQRSVEIGMIVETIEEIASQTNLLALNANIEAARAGVHGKGFAVVAEAVGRLAMDAKEATKDIVILVKEIQNTVARAVTAMDAGAAEVEAGVARAQQSGQALNDILTAAQMSSRQITEISEAAQRISDLAGEMVRSMDAVSAVVEENTAATEEMTASAEQVLGSIDEIAGVSEEQTAATEQVSASVEEVSAQAEEVTASAQALRAMAQDLQALVTRFKLPSA